MKRIHLIVFACALPVILSPAVAGDQAALPAVTIDQLVARALGQNAELRFYEAEVAAAKGMRTQAGLWQNPEFSGDYGSRRVTDNSGILQGDGYTRSFSVSQTFEFPGKGSLRKAIANKNIDLAETGLLQFRRALEGQIRNLAVEYVTAVANVDAAEEIKERSFGLVKLLQERPAAGVQQMLELRVIEGSLLEIHRAHKDFVMAREEVRIELNALLGFPSSQSLHIQWNRELPPLERGDASRLILIGLSHNYQLKIRTLELERAVREVSAAKLDVAPDFSVGPFFSQDKAGDLEENLGTTVTVTLPLWNWNQGNITAAQARRVQADSMLLDARRKVEASIARRLRSYELNRKQLQEMPEKTIENLREASDLADRQYRTGAINVQLFLEVQREYLNARKIRNETLQETWKNWLDLQLLVGAQEGGKK